MRVGAGAALLVCASVASVMGLGGCALASPFRGPGYSSREGVVLPGVGETVWVGITNAQVDRATRRVFDDHTRKVIDGLPASDGFVGYSLRSRILGNEVWTMTVWRDEEALDGFVSSSVHRAAMREGMSPVIRAKFLRFELPSDAVPMSWDEVLVRLDDVAFVNYGQSENATDADQQHERQSDEYHLPEK